MENLSIIEIQFLEHLKKLCIRQNKIDGAITYSKINDNPKNIKIEEV